MKLYRASWIRWAGLLVLTAVAAELAVAQEPPMTAAANSAAPMDKPSPTTAPVPIATDVPQQGVAVAQPARPGLTVVIRGLAGYWPGCDTFCQRVRRYGEYVQLYATGIEAGADSANIAGQVRAGYWSHIRIVGYSFGADAAIEYARDMQRHGVQVERLILIEPTTPGTVPGNVAYCYNVYESRPRTDWVPAFRGVAVQRESWGTRLVNHDVARTRSSLTRLNHLNFSYDAQVQSIAAYQAGVRFKTAPAVNIAQQQPAAAASATVANQSAPPVQEARSTDVPAPK